MIHVAFEIAPIARKFSGDSPFELCFERDWDLPPALFAGKIEGYVLGVGSHLSVHTCKDDSSSACLWATSHKKYI